MRSHIIRRRQKFARRLPSWGKSNRAVIKFLIKQCGFELGCCASKFGIIPATIFFFQIQEERSSRKKISWRERARHFCAFRKIVLKSLLSNVLRSRKNILKRKNNSERFFYFLRSANILTHSRKFETYVLMPYSPPQRNIMKIKGEKSKFSNI